MYVRRLPLKQKGRKAVMRGEWEVWDKLNGAKVVVEGKKLLCRD